MAQQCVGHVAPHIVGQRTLRLVVTRRLAGNFELLIVASQSIAQCFWPGVGQETLERLCTDVCESKESQVVQPYLLDGFSIHQSCHLRSERSDVHCGTCSVMSERDVSESKPTTYHQARRWYVYPPPSKPDTPRVWYRSTKLLSLRWDSKLELSYRTLPRKITYRFQLTRPGVVAIRQRRSVFSDTRPSKSVIVVRNDCECS